MLRPAILRLVRGGLGRECSIVGILVTTMIAILVGLLLLVAGGEIGLGCAGTCALILALALLPGHVRVGAPFALLLFVPFDHLLASNAERLGWPVLLLAVALCIGCMLKWRSLVISKRDWDIHLLILAKLGSGLAHFGAGQVRMVLFWLAAGAIVIWFRTEEQEIRSVRNQILLAVMCVGAAQGLLAIVEALQLIDLRALISGYEPNVNQLMGTFGIRSLALSGDPLRLGTLTMLSGLISLSRITMPGHLRLKRGIYAWALLFSIAGLVLSGARGSWLGFIAGSCVMGAALLTKARIQRVGWALLSIAGVVILVDTTDLGARIGERLWGSSVHPMSLEQRIEAMRAVAMVWRDAPVFGVGPGGMAGAVYSVGMRVANVENEYLIALLGGGAVCLFSLCIVVVRRNVQAWRYRDAPFGFEVLAGIVALSVNVATYNLWSWSAGAGLFAALVLLPRSSLEAASSVEIPQ